VKWFGMDFRTDLGCSSEYSNEFFFIFKKIKLGRLKRRRVPNEL